MASIKAQGLFDVAYPDFDPEDGDQYEKQLILEKQPFVYSVLVISHKLTKEENWPRSLKEMQGPSFLSSTIMMSNAAQHEGEIVSLLL